MHTLRTTYEVDEVCKEESHLPRRQELAELGIANK